MPSYNYDLIPDLDELPASPKRCVLHWTGGPGKANQLDKKSYHFIFNQPTGELVTGLYPVKANMRVVSDRNYAAHIKGMNSFSVGFSFAGMLNAAPATSTRPVQFGPCPLTEKQVQHGLLFVAMCCKKWRLDPKNSAHLFTHYEAETIHNVKQNNKWDITVLKFMPHLKKDEVGPWLRAATAEHLAAL